MEKYNIGATLDKTAEKYPYQPAIYFPGKRDRDGRLSYQTLSFKQLSELSSQYAQGFLDYGIKQGDRSLLMVRPSIDFIAAAFALLKIGAVPVLIDPGMGTKPFLQCVAETEPVNMIGIPIAHILRFFIRKPFKSIKRFITVGRRLFWPGAELRDLKAENYSDLETAETNVDDEAAVAFTSGSTGIPKGVVFEHGMFKAMIEILQNEIGVKPGTIDLPGLYIFALFNPALGVTTVMPDMDASNPAQLNPAYLYEAIEAFGVTHSFGSPTIWKIVGKYCEENDLTLQSMKMILMAGAPVPPDLIERYKQFMPNGTVFTPYGATEALPLTLIDGDHILQETAVKSESGAGMCVGVPYPGIEIKVIKISDDPIEEWESSLEIAQGQIGEITAMGPVVTKKYLHRPEQTAAAKIRNGNSIMHRMGDVGYFDEEGRLWFCGRKAHRVETSQGLLFPVQIEPYFNSIPGVKRTAVVKYQQNAALVIECDPGLSGAEKTAVDQAARQRLAEKGLEDKIEFVKFMESFPVDVRHNAKIKREEIAELIS